MVGQVVYRYEFAPFDLGSSLNLERTRKKINTTVRDLGWVDASEDFAGCDISHIIPNNVALLKADDVLVYIPESGFGVARYRFEHRGGTSDDVVVDALLARREFQKEIDEGSFEQNAFESYTRVASLVATLRKELQRGNNPERRLLIPRETLHGYSLSVFAVRNQLPDWLGWCLLQPRALGCSVSAEQPPTKEALSDAIKGCRDAELPLTEIQEDIAAADGVFSSWSAVLVDETATSNNLDLVTLCEFRVQSTWYAANCASEIAARAPETSNLNRRKMMIRLSQTAFERTRWLSERRLGANDPEKPKQILDQIIATSDVQREVENAEAALSQALAHAELEIERRSAYGRKLLQVFSLIFASAGLAQVMLPLPITLEVFQEHLLAILIWLGMTLLGALLVIRQER